jgi:hypothetical protein
MIYPQSVREIVRQVGDAVRRVTDEALARDPETEREFFYRMKALKIEELRNQVADGMIANFSVSGEYRPGLPMQLELSVMPMMPANHISISVNLFDDNQARAFEIAGELWEKNAGKKAERIHFI